MGFESTKAQGLDGRGFGCWDALPLHLSLSFSRHDPVCRRGWPVWRVSRRSAALLPRLFSPRAFEFHELARWVAKERERIESEDATKYIRERWRNSGKPGLSRTPRRDFIIVHYVRISGSVVYVWYVDIILVYVYIYTYYVFQD